jgi:transcriptional regulator with XRE-family HTH domain
MPTQPHESLVILERFSERLRRLRLAKGLTQEEMAARAGFSRSYYTQVESGKRNVALLNLYRLAQSLEISLKDLLDIEDR